MMTKIEHELAEIRSRICDWSVIAVCIFATPTIFASLLRLPETGWHWVMALHIVGLLICWATALLHKVIPHQIRSSIVICVFLLAGISGATRFGMVAGATPMLILAPVLGTFLFSATTGFILAAISILLYAGVGILIVTGQITQTFDANQHIVSPIEWAIHTLSYLMTILVVIAAIIMMRRHLLLALVRSQNSATELIEFNQNLEKLVADRTQELEQARDDANRLAQTDALTNLYNRRAFFEQGNKIDSQSRRYQRTYTVAMIDIDHFKSINDRWGHKTGDEVLRAVGGVLISTLRKHDLIARIGGEEFAVVMPETPLAEAQQLAERLRSTLERTAIKIAEGNIYISVSIGLAALAEDTENLETVLSQSDIALYKAKADGRNCVRSYDNFDVKSV